MWKGAQEGEDWMVPGFRLSQCSSCLVSAAKWPAVQVLTSAVACWVVRDSGLAPTLPKSWEGSTGIRQHCGSLLLAAVLVV